MCLFLVRRRAGAISAVREAGLPSGAPTRHGVQAQTEVSKSGPPREQRLRVWASPNAAVQRSGAHEAALRVRERGESVTPAPSEAPSAC